MTPVQQAERRVHQLSAELRIAQDRLRKLRHQAIADGVDPGRGVNPYDTQSGGVQRGDVVEFVPPEFVIDAASTAEYEVAHRSF